MQFGIPAMVQSGGNTAEEPVDWAPFLPLSRVWSALPKKNGWTCERQSISDDNHWPAHMTLTDRNICNCAVFANTFNFGLPTYFFSHYCYRRAL